MPTITVDLKDLFELSGEALELPELEERLRLAKAELDDHDEESGEVRIELNDTNRPDLWCTEGIARQIRSHGTGQVPSYPFFKHARKPDHHIEVDPGLKEIRPYVAAFRAKGPAVTDEFLVQIIQTQEKLCENFGRKRRDVAIGIYNAAKIAFPVKYVAAKPSEYRFVPLGFDEAMPLDRVVKEHPKGREYGHLVEGLGGYPLLADSKGVVLSFPPIINSRETGEVMVGDQDLFVEATGHDMRQLVLVMNIMAVNFADRGWKIEPVTTRFGYDTAFGKEVVVPASLNRTLELGLTLFEKSMGEDYALDEIIRSLSAYGVQSEGSGEMLKVRCPDFRDDYLHPMDVVEDFAISKGFHSFEPEMPSRFTVGKLKPVTLLTDRVREHMVGSGFEEIFSNILTNRTVEREHMLLADSPIVSVDNIMTETYSVLRSAVIPSLLRVEAQSSKALYPHRLFEAGEVCRWAEERATGSVTEHRLAALMASSDSGFSQIHSVVDMLLYYLVKDYRLEPATFPFYFEGRAAELLINDAVAGHLGEIHPEVLTRFNITVPCAAFEITLDRLGP